MTEASTTLTDVMLGHARMQGDANSQCTLHNWQPTTKSYTPVSYQALTRRAFSVGQRLLDQGCEWQSVCLIACHSPYASLVAFYGAIAAGVIPMILPMPKALGSNDALVERLTHWNARFVNKRSVLILEEGLDEKFHQQIPSSLAVIRIKDTPDAHWHEQSTPPTDWRPVANDIAFFQTTSSSTGDHKAVAISHGNILSNVHGIRTAVDMNDDERMISWLPLFHDMGLVGTVLFTYCNHYPLYLMTPIQFVKRPALWLKGMSEHRCTIATAPNFGYDYCSRLVSDKDAAGLDLHCVKHLFIGAEPIRVPTIQSFINKFKPAGITEQKIRPAYGLAESTIITSISLPQKLASFACLDPDKIGMNQPISIEHRIPFTANELNDYEPNENIAVCTAGSAIAGMHLSIIDEDANPVTKQGHAGEIAVTGHSVALGYVAESQSQSQSQNLVEPFKNNQLRTGDMGVLINDELYIIERIKNIIIRNGENFLVSALEQQLADLLQTSHDHIAVFETDIHDPTSDIVVLVERHRGLDDQQSTQLLNQLPKESYPINRILFSQAREIPRTTSGKKRHFYCRKLYQSTTLNYHQSVEVPSTS